jgi:Cu-Zn family superoxide dismutase
VEFKPQLKGLPRGERGFHVHEKPDCGPKDKDGKPAAVEGGRPHWDPDKHAQARGPKGRGISGRLPALDRRRRRLGDQDRSRAQLKLADLAGKSLMIHAGSDTYAEPAPNGGGGDRIACGVIK